MNDNRPYYTEVNASGPCDTCGVDRGHPCRTKRGGPAGRPHKPRVDAYKREAERRAANMYAATTGTLPEGWSPDDLIPNSPHPFIEVECAIVDSAINVRRIVLITISPAAENDAREWCEGQQDTLFARYVIDGHEVIGWPTPNGIEWKESVPA